MILTVTINPLLERRYLYEHAAFGAHNRNGKNELKAGGKGINVSRQLNFLSTENLAYTFLGGVNGKILRDVLNQEQIKFTSVKSDQETRDAAVVVDESAPSVSTFFAVNSSVSESEVEEFMSKLEKMIRNCEIVVFAGSSPCGEADKIFPFGIETANKYDKISVCDTYGDHLKTCIEKSPTILHNNKQEIEKSLGIKLNSEKDFTEFLDGLYSKGVKQAFITDGSRYSYASNFDFHFKIKSPEVKTIDPTGSGDSFVAGIVYGWHNNLTFDEEIKLAVALGAVNASRTEVCTATQTEAEEIIDDVILSPLGKKMKTLDVTPR